MLVTLDSHIHCEAVVDAVTYDGRFAEEPATHAPWLPYRPGQLPSVVVSARKNWLELVEIGTVYEIVFDGGLSLFAVYAVT
jgi:hypothetical protein